MILAGRSINDAMPKYVAEMAVKGLNKVGKTIKGSNVLIMGLTYKEDVADIRESPVENMVRNSRSMTSTCTGTTRCYPMPRSSTSVRNPCRSWTRRWMR